MPAATWEELSDTEKELLKDIYDFYIKTKSYKQTMEKFGIKSKNTINQIRIKFK